MIKGIIENTTTIDINRSNVKATLVCSDVTNKNTGQKVRQCKHPQGENHNNQVVCDVSPIINNSADSCRVNQSDFGAQVLQAPHQVSNEIHSMSRHNNEKLHDMRGQLVSAKVGVV